MKLYSLTLPVDNGFEALSELGALECIQFSDFDANPQVMKHIFFSEALMVQEMLADLDFIRNRLQPFISQEISPYLSEDDSSLLLSETKQNLKGKTLGQFLHNTQNEIQKEKSSLEQKIKALQAIEERTEIGIEKFLLMIGIKRELKEGFGFISEPNSAHGGYVLDSNPPSFSGKNFFLFINNLDCLHFKNIFLINFLQIFSSLL